MYKALIKFDIFSSFFQTSIGIAEENCLQIQGGYKDFKIVEFTSSDKPVLEKGIHVNPATNLEFHLFGPHVENLDDLPHFQNGKSQALDMMSKYPGGQEANLAIIDTNLSIEESLGKQLIDNLTNAKVLAKNGFVLLFDKNNNHKSVAVWKEHLMKKIGFVIVSEYNQKNGEKA